MAERKGNKQLWTSVILTGATVTGLGIIFSMSGGNENRAITPGAAGTTPNNPNTEEQALPPAGAEQQQGSPQQNQAENLCPPEYYSRKIKKGDWLTQILREYGAPGIDSGPYQVIHNDGSVQKFKHYSQLPDSVFPGETFCFADFNKTSSLEGGTKIMGRKGIIYDNKVVNVAEDIFKGQKNGTHQNRMRAEFKTARNFEASIPRRG